MKVASFFSGIGGFDLAFEKAGFEVIYQCEIDPFCQKVLRKHWPDVRLGTDIRSTRICDVKEADIFCAGFPCQDLSLANQGKRKGLEGKRSGLFHTVAELAGEVLPKWIVLENVVGLLNSNNGEDFGCVLQSLEELGYFVAWRVLDAKHFGSAQRRRRVFIVASHRNDGSARVLFGHGAVGQMVDQTKLPGAHSPSRFTGSDFQTNMYVIQHATIGRKPEAGPQAKGYRNDGETYTLDSRGSSDVVCAPNVGFGIRNTTGVSSELDGRRLRALGNAVNVDVVYWIASRIREAEGTLRGQWLESESPSILDNV
jgi:DNA (cytosine-5)-methyltransferase 1